MKTTLPHFDRIGLLLILLTLPFLSWTKAQEPGPEAPPSEAPPSETPTTPPTEPSFTVRDEMIPMRDGIRLYTLILTPEEAAGPTLD